MGVMAIINMVLAAISAAMPIIQGIITDIEAAQGDATAHKATLTALQDSHASLTAAKAAHATAAS